MRDWRSADRYQLRLRVITIQVDSQIRPSQDIRKKSADELLLLPQIAQGLVLCDDTCCVESYDAS